MRTYDDSFSGQKIYPGKVRSAVPTMTRARPQISLSRCSTTYTSTAEDTAAQLEERVLTETIGQAVHPR
jgi:hypothetical protein